MSEDPEELKKEIQRWQSKYVTMKERYIRLEQSTLAYKIKKKSDSFWSVVSVFLNASDNGTSLLQKLRMFFGTMLAWAKNGFKLEEEQTAEARFAICKACPELIKGTQCNLCGCMMKAKTKIAGASCPLAKW